MKILDAAELMSFVLNEERLDDDVWYQLCVGETAALEAASRREGLDSAQELAEKLAVFAPMDERVRRGTLLALRARLHRPPSVVGSSGSGPQARAGRGRTLTRLGGLLAMAAALVLLWSLRDRGTGEGHPPMPGFTLEFRNGHMSELRGGGGAPSLPPEECDARYGMGDMMVIALAPQFAIHDELSVALRVHGSASGRWLTLTSAPSPGPDGRLTIKQPVSALELPPGRFSLSFYVTRSGSIHDWEALAERAAGTHPGVVVLPQTLCIEEEGR